MAYVNADSMIRSRLGYDEYHEVKFSTTLNYFDIYSWCQANCVGRYYVSSFYAVFADIEDAVKCKLVWGEE